MTAWGEAVGVDPSSYREDPRAWTQVGHQVPRVDHLDLSAFALDAHLDHPEWASSSLAWAVEVGNEASKVLHWPQTLA